MSKFQSPKYMLNIKIASSDPNVIKHYENFTSHHKGDSGIDLYTPEDVYYTRELNRPSTIDFGIQCEMINIKNNELTSYYLYPRSSICKTSFFLANSVGIIDAGYRGNILAKIHSIHDMVILPKGSQFQLCAPDLKPIVVKIVTELSDTSRGSGGFGSTNVVK